MPAFDVGSWKWENATAGAVAGFATTVALHPLDVVRTRFQVKDTRASNLPVYKNTGHAIYTIVRTEALIIKLIPQGLLLCLHIMVENMVSFVLTFDGIFVPRYSIFVHEDKEETLYIVHCLFQGVNIATYQGLRGLYAGFYPAVFGSTISWGLYFFLHAIPLLVHQSYSRAKYRYLKGKDEQLSPGYHLLSAAEAGALVCLFTNPIWLVKTRLQLQTLHQNRPYFGFSDALRTILREEGWRALYKGTGPGLLLVSHGAIQFTVYEELRKIAFQFKSTKGRTNHTDGDRLLNSFDYAMLGAASKISAILLTYPYQVIRARLQQRPSNDGNPKYLDSWHVVKETLRYEGIRGFYRGITANILKNVPAASITFVVYENVLSLFRVTGRHN